MALFEEKYPGHHSSLIDSRFGAWGHRFRCACWWLGHQITRRPGARENYWSGRLTAAYQHAFSRKRKRLADDGVALRRIEPALPLVYEEAVASDGLRWEAQDGGGGTRRLYPFENDDSRCKPTTMSDHRCLEVSNPFGAPWVYFRIDPIFSHSSPSIIVTCEVLTLGGGLWIEYDSDDSDVQVAQGMPGAFKGTPRQVTEVGPVWKTHEFSIPDLRPSGRINGGDFRIACDKVGGESFFIRRLEVRRSEASSGANALPTLDVRGIGFARSSSPDVSIVIPVHNQLAYTTQCLQSISTHGAECSLEVVVVDDGSTDGTAALLSRVDGS